jgi:predicted ATP-dependent serine protease
MAVRHGSRDTDERKDLDELFSEQEMMVKELDYSFIVVSHVNDFGQTRGSRWSSKMADVRIDLSREMGSNILRIDLTKNRFIGKTGFAGNYSFDTFTRQYSEVTNDNDKEERKKKETA